MERRRQLARTGGDGTAFQGVLEVDFGVLQFAGAVLGKNAAGAFCDHVAVAAGATLRGTGSIFCQKPSTGTIKGVKVFANGALVVGNSTGLLQVIELELDPAAVLGIHIDGSASSLLQVLGGDVVIDESRLDVLLDSPPLLGHEYLIVQSDGTSPVLGRFQGLPESGDVLFAVRDGIAYGFSIDYAAGDGNDIALRAQSAQAVPVPGAVGLLAVGLATMIARGALRATRPGR